MSTMRRRQWRPLSFTAFLLKKVSEVLNDFGGIWRRFERVGEYKEAIIISDYAHHPTAVEKTLLAARSIFPKRRIMAVFSTASAQSHAPAF